MTYRVFADITDDGWWPFGPFVDRTNAEYCAVLLADRDDVRGVAIVETDEEVDVTIGDFTIVDTE